MFGYNRERRPVDYGPYPLEKIKRDTSIIEKEKASSATISPPISVGQNKYLSTAIQAHLDAYVALREPTPFSKMASVPDDLAIRASDLKGAGYFLDASQIGICEIIDTGWVNQ